MDEQFELKISDDPKSSTTSEEAPTKDEAVPFNMTNEKGRNKRACIRIVTFMHFFSCSYLSYRMFTLMLLPTPWIS